MFNTYQAYLKGALQNMELDMQIARREGWHFGAKLVRGAYMEQVNTRKFNLEIFYLKLDFFITYPHI